MSGNTPMPESKETPGRSDTLSLASSIVAAYVSRNSVPMAELPNVMKSVHGALRGLAPGESPSTTTQKPAVPIKKSITADYLVCLEDGQKLKMLKQCFGCVGLNPPHEASSLRQSLPRLPLWQSV